MMRLLSLVIAIGVTCAAAPVSATTRPSEEAFLLPNPTTYATTVRTGPTRAGSTYTVMVTGIYSYNGWLGLMDCGHKDESDARGWQSVPNIGLDGRPADCFDQRFDKTHSYSWHEPGTGSPFVFSIQYYHFDESRGSVIVTVVED